MGNFSAQCFADEPEERNEMQIRLNQQKSDYSQNVSVQNIKKDYETNLFQQDQNEIGGIKKANQDCLFCRNHYSQLVLEENSEQLVYPSNRWQEMRKHSSQIYQVKESNVFTDPLALLQNDPISQYTSEWFQLALSLPKYIKSREHFDGLPEQQQFDFLNSTLDQHDLHSLICLKWCVVDFFRQKNSLFPTNHFLESCCVIFYNIAHLCQFYNELFMENYRENQYTHNIRLYIKLYHQFQRLMNTFQNSYDLQFDIMQMKYEKQFNKQKDGSNFYPHFKLIGYMIRFWCQITLTIDVQNILKLSYRNLNIEDDKDLIQQYVIAALDVDIDEYNVHWIGHREHFSIEKTLLDYNIIEQLVEKQSITNQDFYQQIDEKLDQLRLLYPQWFFEVEFECLGIQHKIARLVSDVKSQNSSEIAKLKKTDDTENLENYGNCQFEIILNSANTLKQENSEDKEVELMALYIQESNLMPRSKFRQSCSYQSTVTSFGFKQKGFNYSTQSILKASQEALQISKEIGMQYKQKLTEFNDRLQRVQDNISSREQILEERADQFKIPRDVNVEWLNFFKKTDFNKILVDKKPFKKLVKNILQELVSSNLNYESQLIQFQ
ncbi:unnamed protein product (macronuclear) [Paramecium tetraurelia]|uniref:Uncharacterized protein n=1 Tax=Paramecium tetraurelia TaxID=5888 RepID=A0CJN1_PARTE|nr:uncharacterized protein GSPATT00000710001 [Paramecium tetraurelia]CAK70998.1 unnamed protein product [Paramecium tetraurelia]|eukprot:XP_001438395.1 hypothetical protein (macronuclear) [Paramecium tetraurelia strain d4-2]